MRIGNNFSGINSNKSVNFKGVVPVRVYGWLKTGENVETLFPATQMDSVKKSIESFCILLANEAGGRTEVSKFFKEFSNNVHDYMYYRKYVKNGKIVRTHTNNDRGYIFTGNAAQMIEKHAKKLGPAKQDGRIYSGTNNTSEVKYLRYNYQNVIYNFINNLKERITDGKNNLEMHLFVKPYIKKVKGQDVQKFKLEDISFVKEGTTEPQIKRSMDTKEIITPKKNTKPIELNLFD